MAFTLSRIDRKTRTYELSATVLAEAAAIPPDLTGVDVALLPPRGAPTASTVWFSADYADGSFTVLLAGPDADSTGALVVPASADIWMRIADTPEVDAEKLERITVLGGGGSVPSLPGTTVASVNGKSGTVTLTAADVAAQPAGSYATTADLSDGLAAKVNSSTYTAGLAAKQDMSTLGADVAANATVQAAFGTPGGAEGFVAADDVRMPSLVFAVAGDSTGDEITEWAWRGISMWAADRPDLTASGFYGYGESGPYVAQAIQTGVGGYWTNQYTDTFTRTGDLFGSLPDKGAAYGGAAGAWTMDGTVAVSAGTGNSATQDLGAAQIGGRRRATLSVVMDTTPAATDKVITLFVGATTNNRVQLRVSVTTAGTQVWILNKIVGGVTTLLATGSGNPFTASAVNSFDMSIELNGTTGVSARVGALSVTGTLSAGEATAIVDGARTIYFQTVNTGSAGIKVDKATGDKWTSSARTLTVYNGSRAGSVAQYAIDRMASLYPSNVSIDVLVVSYGHNYGSQSTAALLAAIEALCTAFRAAHPEAGIVLASQNPEFTPAGNVAAHQARNAALRRYATQHRYGYLPVYELYASQPDGGASWVQSDGVHPTRAAEAVDPNNGSYQAATILRSYLNGMSKRVA